MKNERIELAQALPMRVAYLVNQYPKVSHSFIRREILAVEELGIDVLRISVRGWDGDVVDPEDELEQTKTRYVLKDGMRGLAAAVLGRLVRSPRRFGQALKQAFVMSRGADRPLPYHMIYLAEACRIADWLEECEVRHLHAHFGTNPAEVALLASMLSGVPFSFTVHGSEEFDRPITVRLGEKVAHASFVVAITSYCRSQLFRWADTSHWHKVRVVHCGLERSFHDVPPVPMAVAPRLVCVGRLCEQKGQLMLLEAAATLARDGVDFELVLAGDGDMRPQIEARIAAFGLEGKVRITGWISSAQVREELLAARALVLPSFAEGLPIVVMEAMALRRPVITTWITGIPELVVDGEHGWLLPPGSEGDLVRAMRACLAAPVELLEEMGARGRERVLARHDIQREAVKLAALFRGTAAAPVGETCA